MAHVTDNLPPPPQPGINGLRYYTTTGQKLFMRVRVDPTTLEPAGQPERSPLAACTTTSASTTCLSQSVACGSRPSPSKSTRQIAPAKEAAASSTVVGDKAQQPFSANTSLGKARINSGVFLENIALRHDNSMLITVVTRNEVYYLSPPSVAEPVEFVLLHSFGEMATGMAELEPDVFAVISNNAIPPNGPKTARRLRAGPRLCLWRRGLVS